MYSVQYGTKTIDYTVVRKPSLKHTYIHVGREGVIVKANKKISEREIEAFVLKKSAWILKHLNTYKAKAEEGEIQTGSRIYYLGKDYYVELVKELRRNIEVDFTHSKFVVKAPETVSPEMLQEAFDAFYKANAPAKILPMVEKWAQRMGVSPEHVSFRKARSRWGSCSSRNRISLNCYLMKLPLACIEYVVVHELAHIRHKNHSAEFWAEVGKHLPDYRDRKTQIRAFEKRI